MEKIDIKIDKQDEFIGSSPCLFQLTKGDKFIPGLIAVTGTEVLIFNDYVPSERVGIMHIYHPVFTFPYVGIKYIGTANLFGNNELKEYFELTIFELNSDKTVSVYLNKKKSKNYKKITKLLKKVGNIKIRNRDRDCSIYN